MFVSFSVSFKREPGKVVDFGGTKVESIDVYREGLALGEVPESVTDIGMSLQSAFRFIVGNTAFLYLAKEYPFLTRINYYKSNSGLCLWLQYALMH